MYVSLRAAISTTSAAPDELEQPFRAPLVSRDRIRAHTIPPKSMFCQFLRAKIVGLVKFWIKPHEGHVHFMRLFYAKLAVFTIGSRKIIKWDTSTLWFILCKRLSFYSSREKNHKVGKFFKETISMFSFKNHPTLWFFARLLWKLWLLRKINHKVEVPHFMIFLLAIVQTGIFVENNIIKWQLRKCPNLWSAVKPLQKRRRRRNTYIINWDWRKNCFLSCCTLL